MLLMPPLFPRRLILAPPLLLLLPTPWPSPPRRRPTQATPTRLPFDCSHDLTSPTRARFDPSIHAFAIC